jgi:uncharacterized secreted protein with C-terminal beta-propeller domain
MVQKEIKNKVPVYGIIGVLSAIILVAMIYSYGTLPISPQLSPSPSVGPSTSPGVSPSALPTVNPSNAPVTPSGTETPVVNPEPSAMQSFESYDDLKNFVVSNTGGNYWVRGDGSTTSMPTPSAVPAPVPTSAPSMQATVGSLEGAKAPTDSSGHSITNIQVAGVDEADTIKTDGTYLYTIANNTVFILNAGASNPADARVVAKIPGDNTYISGIYLSDDGNKLVVLGSQYIPYIASGDAKESFIMPPYWGGSSAFVHVYDVANKAGPVLVRNFTMSGNYFNSRMIGDYVYAIITESTYVGENGAVNLPVVFEKAPSNIDASRILYVPGPSSYYTYTSVISINVLNNAQAPSNTTIMMGGSSEMYVSASSIYLTTQNWDSRSTYTSIYRVGINQNAVSPQAKGSVPGYPINQYAMDEYNGYFRMATTAWAEDNATTTDGAVFKVTRQINSIYVLGADLKIVGKLEKFKMDENLFAARFVGDKCYIVTFKQIDPFFIIDMSNPSAPKVAGQLKIPGYSSYLHPLDATHVIGLGKENNTLKLSLFDVSNVNAPTEIAKYIVSASYSDSSALYDPHAFLFDASKQMLVIPVSINDYPTIMPLVPGTGSATTDLKAPERVQNWQGAYVFNVNAAGGFTLKGQVTQVSSAVSTEYWMSSSYWINRAAFIGNTLYTFSNSAVQLNSLGDLATLKLIELK